MFNDILEPKNDIVRNKKKELQTVQKWRYCQPWKKTHAFGQKMAIFSTFSLANIGQENVFYDILELKNDSLG